MLKKLALLLTLLLGVITVTAQEPTQVDVEYGNIRFSYPESLSIGVEIIEHEEVLPADAENPFEVSPAYTEFFFADYNGGVQAFHEPRILVYPTANFEAFADEQNSVFTPFGQLQMLQTILSDLPALDGYMPPQTEPTPYEILPLLPQFNAVQVLRIQPEYVEFQNGSGIRYISYYSQALNPITDTELFYTFQGLTDDGQYYISAILPILSNVPELQFVDDDDFDYDAFASGYETYLTYVDERLTDIPGDSFTPTLATLDAWMATFAVGAD